ncbi:MAG: metalloregulator ArsR/SmtB family transcription factor [Bacillota bacterium]
MKAVLEDMAMVNPELIETLVEFHKTLADETRLKLVGLLALRPTCGQELAEQLGVSTPTISHHIGRLKKLDLVNSVRENNTVYYSINVQKLRDLTKAILANEEPVEPAPMQRPDDRQKTLQNFMDNGRVKEMPTQRKRRLYILEELLKSFSTDRDYTEAEVNEMIKARYDDYCTVRREFIMFGYMERNNGIYRVNPETKWYKV